MILSLISLSDKFGIFGKVGVGYYNEIVPLFEASFFYGNNKHIAEIGGGVWAFEGAMISANYRYRGEKGFLFKAGFTFVPGEEGAPLIGLGYSF